jgi:hypothetical protein
LSVYHRCVPQGGAHGWDFCSPSTISAIGRPPNDRQKRREEARSRQSEPSPSVPKDRCRWAPRVDRTPRPVVPFSFLRCSGAFELTAYPKTQLYNLQRGGPAGTPRGASLSRRARTCSGCDHRQRQSASSKPPAKSQENHIIQRRFHTAWVKSGSVLACTACLLYPNSRGRQATPACPFGANNGSLNSCSRRAMDRDEVSAPILKAADQ